MNFNSETTNFILENFNNGIFNKKNLQKFRSTLISNNYVLSKYLLDIVITDLRRLKVSALYSSDERKIFLDINLLKQEIVNLINDGLLLGDNYELYLIILLYYFCLHESVHAFQRMIIDENINAKYRNLIIDSENAIMGNIVFPNGGRIGSIKNTLMANKLYNQFHDFYPVERHADVISSTFLYPILEDMMPGSFEVDDMRFINVSSLLKGYDGIFCPLDTFYEEVFGCSKVRINLNDYSNSEKFMFGLPLTKEKLDFEVFKIDSDYSGFSKRYLKDK